MSIKIRGPKPIIDIDNYNKVITSKQVPLSISTTNMEFKKSDHPIILKDTYTNNVSRFHSLTHGAYTFDIIFLLILYKTKFCNIGLIPDCVNLIVITLYNLFRKELYDARRKRSLGNVRIKYKQPKGEFQELHCQRQNKIKDLYREYYNNHSYLDMVPYRVKWGIYKDGYRRYLIFSDGSYIRYRTKYLNASDVEFYDIDIYNNSIGLMIPDPFFSKHNL